MAQYHFIFTACPINNLASETERAYRELHVMSSSKRDITALAYSIADISEEAQEQGLSVEYIECLSTENEFCEAWHKLTEKPYFKTF